MIDDACPGPLIWFACDGGGVLECAACGYWVTTGNFNDLHHAVTPVLTEGLAS